MNDHVEISDDNNNMRMNLDPQLFESQLENAIREDAIFYQLEDNDNDVQVERSFQLSDYEPE